jgi:hypothetical protein
MGLGSGIRKKPIPDPGSRGQKGTGSLIRIRNTDHQYQQQVSRLLSSQIKTVMSKYEYRRIAQTVCTQILKIP